MKAPQTKRNAKIILDGPGEPWRVVFASVSEELEQQRNKLIDALEAVLSLDIPYPDGIDDADYKVWNDAEKLLAEIKRSKNYER